MASFRYGRISADNGLVAATDACCLIDCHTSLGCNAAAAAACRRIALVAQCSALI